MSDNFDEIIGPLVEELPSPDDCVNVILVDGTTLEFRDIVTRELASRLIGRGYAELVDSHGNTCFLFTHGVCAIIARKETSNDPQRCVRH